jgi:hypothetical protein
MPATWNLTRLIEQALLQPPAFGCDYIPRIRELQASIYHLIGELLEVLHRGYA